MMPTPLVRNLISRGTALVIGLLLLRCTLYFLRGLLATTSEAQALTAQHPLDATPADQATGTLTVFVIVFGGPALLLILFAILPTRWLYALPFVSPPSEARDDVAVIRTAGRFL